MMQPTHFTHCARQPFWISLPVFPISGMGSAYPRGRTLASPMGDCGGPTMCLRGNRHLLDLRTGILRTVGPEGHHH